MYCAGGKTIAIIDPGGWLTPMYPCFEHSTLPNVMPSFPWRYYAPGAGSIWTAKNAGVFLHDKSPQTDPADE